jgi:sugar lactone lactonase YvrE
VYVTDWYNNRVQKFTGDGEFLTAFGAAQPSSIAVDGSGQIYVGEWSNHTVIKLSATGERLATWSGYAAPAGIAIDSAGNIYVADAGNRTITKLTSAGVVITTWGTAGTGVGQFQSINGLEVDGTGNVYVADSGYYSNEGNHRIQKFDSNGVFLSQWGGPGTAAGQFLTPGGIAVFADRVYVADGRNNRIQIFDSTGTVLSTFGDLHLYGGQFKYPDGLTIAPTDEIYIADTGNHRIQKLTTDGTFAAQWGSYGTGPGEFNYPYDVAVDSHGNIYVADSWNHRVQKFTAGGDFISQLDGFYYPESVAVDSQNQLFVADRGNGRTVKFDSNGVLLTQWSTPGNPEAVNVDASDQVYVAEYMNGLIQKFDNNGQLLASYNVRPTVNGVGIDHQGNIYVSLHHEVQKLNSQGELLVSWGTRGDSADGAFDYPADVAIDSQGNIYIADSNNHRIQKFGYPSVVAAPSNLQAAVFNSFGIELTWQDNADNENGFKVEWCTGVDCMNFSESTIPNANLQSWSIYGMSANTTYCFRVRAYADNDLSAYTTITCVTTPPPPPPPTAPSNLQAVPVSTTQLNLTWQDNSDTEGGFILDRCQGANCTNFATIAGTGMNTNYYADASLAPGQTYCYRVRAQNPDGQQSGNTTPTCATTFGGVLSPPSDLQGVSRTSTSITLIWSDNSTGESGFKVDRCAGVGCGGTDFVQIATLAANRTAFTNNGLSANSYTYRISAYKGTANSGYSAPATTVTLPVAPRLQRVTTVSEEQIDLVWYDNATNETGFLIERCQNGTCTMLSAANNSTSYADTGLLADTIYQYRMLAYNDGGESRYSATIRRTTGPLPPSNLTAVATAPTRIRLDWSDNATTERGYRVERCTGEMCSNFTQIRTVTVDSIRYSDATVSANTTYCYRLRSYNPNGHSSYTAPVCASTAASVAGAAVASDAVVEAQPRPEVSEQWLQVESPNGERVVETNQQAALPVHYQPTCAEGVQPTAVTLEAGAQSVPMQRSAADPTRYEATLLPNDAFVADSSYPLTVRWLCATTDEPLSAELGALHRWQVMVEETNKSQRGFLPIVLK